MLGGAGDERLLAPRAGPGRARGPRPAAAMRRRRSAEQVRDRAVDPGLPGGWAPGVLEIADEFPAVRRRELCEVVGQTLLRRQRGAEIIGYVDTGWRGRAYLDTHPVAHHHARSGPRTAGQEEPVSTGSDRDESCLERRTPDLSDTGIRPARAQAASSALTRAGTSTKGSGPCRSIVARNRAGALASTCGPYDANGVPGATFRASSGCGGGGGLAGPGCWRLDRF